MNARKWSYRRKAYKPYIIPENWNVKTFAGDFDELINCARCGDVLKYRNSYISQDIITKQGIGYAVCEKCYLRHEIMKYISVVE